MRMSAYEVADAVEMLVSGDIDRLEAEASCAAQARDAAGREREALARREEKDARRRVLERNDKVRDYAADGMECKLSAPRLPYGQSRKDALRAGGVRYLDGQVVATKGEKSIVVKDHEEWDGGSTGKVITKGKRGKGFR